MKNIQIYYFVVGGLLIITSAIAFLYFILLGQKVTLSQWSADIMLGIIGSIFLGLTNNLDGDK